jgi:hypothetical protein
MQSQRQGHTMARESIRRRCITVGIGVAVAVAACPLAHATTLTDYYKTLMAVRKCELVVEDESIAKLQAAIENKVTSVDASSDTPQWHLRRARR